MRTPLEAARVKRPGPRRGGQCSYVPCCRWRPVTVFFDFTVAIPPLSRGQVVVDLGVLRFPRGAVTFVLVHWLVSIGFNRWLLPMRLLLQGTPQ